MMYDRDGSCPMLLRATLCALLTASGCSLVYDFGAFEDVADAGPPDVNPAALTLDTISPNSVNEGEGCAPIVEPGELAPRSTEILGLGCDPDALARAVLIEGSDILPGAVVTLDGLGFAGNQVPAVVGADGTMLGFEISIPVIPTLAAGSIEMIHVTVSQAGIDQTIDLEVGGLDELSVSEVGAAAAINALEAGTLFSAVRIDAPLAATSGAPLVLNATSLIDVTAPMTAHGCDGGNTLTTGGCDGQGGKQGLQGSGGIGGTPNGGGGGGGNQSAGIPGQNGGLGGVKTPNSMLVPLAEHRGQGGGGAVQTRGGDGGGLIAMTSGGAIRIGSAIELPGSAGQDGTQTCNPLLLGDGAAGGGGGAGGSLMVRGRASVIFDETASINLRGGDPGGSNNDECDGGGGSDGRARIDATNLIGSPGVTGVHGAVIADANRLRTGAEAQSIDLAGDAGTPTWISINRGPATSFNLATSQVVTFEPGLNNVCVHVTDPANGTPPESLHCVDFIYLP